MTCANSVQKFADFCFKDLESELFSKIEIAALTTILLLCQINSLMFPTLEIVELKLRAEILAVNCMLSQELIYVGFSFDILLGPFRFFLTANLSTTSTKRCSFHKAAA